MRASVGWRSGVEALLVERRTEDAVVGVALGCVLEDHELDNVETGINLLGDWVLDLFRQPVR